MSAALKGFIGVFCGCLAVLGPFVLSHKDAPWWAIATFFMFAIALLQWQDKFYGWAFSEDVK